VDLREVKTLVLSHGHSDHTGGLKRLVAVMGVGKVRAVPRHCTGRRAIMQLEKAMPGHFILNMSGTALTLRA
jgi:metal-dependent hydrolase (beta-lactamase superfamily II)